ncbi:MAG: reductase [Herbinix sp.]|jgi:nucleoside-diphosphate-sugar epimerase|nr:reductase [Herbinix sp.]
MRILVLGGTRYFGIHMVQSFIEQGHEVTIATRGKTPDSFGSKVSRIILERTSAESIYSSLHSQTYDVICDNLAYCSNDVKVLLDQVHCEKYIMTSSASVYQNQHINTAEHEFDPLSHSLIWCNRTDYPYDEIKRQAECALFQSYGKVPATAVRLPYVIGEDDYTKRLYFYIDHMMKEKPMMIDNYTEQIGFICSTEAGKFIAWLGENNIIGPINGANNGTISLQQIMDYVELKTGRKAILTQEGEPGPYNGQQSFSLDNSKVTRNGYCFPHIEEWIYQLLDNFIQLSLSSDEAL